ncbi:uncharacterized protein STEHIDRAFT_114416 [Stereum hirsutum FP-91666 SS1]|uniref:uncharacterized protein n=1 Tax=Stereum hirsutum (strain FP-91666) TaxID=721885 RepID=UPI0004449605|nr:uncharacterized protein STEHIDRAFT_114416 [Stereum hirsutum FP-91666 SS1]EIM82518.1 hypothetical protein STEHIDRAFT_114416 [Stereum hirsutum FP-91666 SS1]
MYCYHKLGCCITFGQHSSNAAQQLAASPGRELPEKAVATWAFGYDAFDELSYYARKSKFVDGVMTQIHHLPWTATDFDRFLFLRPPTSTFPETAEQRAENKIGWVLLDERHRSKIFVKGVLIRAEDDKTTGLHYGVNFTKEIPLDRDRSGLDDRSEASKAIYQIWKPLLLSSNDARRKYIDLLLHHDQTLDVIELPASITREVASALVVALREEHGEDALFYWANETTESVRIIQSSLKRTPFLLTKLFWMALRQHNTIMSPEEAREKAFTKLLPYHPDEFSVEISVGDETFLSDQLLKPAKERWRACPRRLANNASSVHCDCSALHIGNLFTDELKIPYDEKEDIKFQRGQLVAQMPRRLTHSFAYDDQVLTATISWSAATNYATNFIVWLRTDDDPLLKPALVHRKAPPVVPATGTTTQPHEVDEHANHADNAINRDPGQSRTSPDITIVSSRGRKFPEHVDDAGPSSTQIGAGDMTGPKKCGEPDADPNAWAKHAADAMEPDDPAVSTQEESEPSSGDEVPRHPEFSTAPTDSITLRNILPGKRYVAQVRRDCELAIWSPPLRFIAPPSNPSIITVKWLSKTKLQVEWSGSIAAVTYRVTLHASDGAELAEKDGLEDSSWVGVADPDADSVRVYAFGADETSCLEPGKASVPPNPYLGRSPSPVRPSPPGDASPRSDVRGFSPAPSAGGDSDDPEAVTSQSAESGHRDHTHRPVPKRPSLDKPNVASGSKSRADNAEFDDFEDDTTDEEEEEEENGEEFTDDDNHTASIWQFNKDDQDFDSDKDADDDEERLQTWMINGKELAVDRCFEVTYKRGKASSPVVIQVHAIVKRKSGKTAKLQKHELVLLHQGAEHDDGSRGCDLVEKISTVSIVDIIQEVEVDHAESPADIPRQYHCGSLPVYVCRWTMSHVNMRSATIFRIPPGPDWEDLLEEAAHPEVAGHVAPDPQFYSRPTTLEFYAGTGGTARGFQAAGFRAIAGVESDLYAAMGYEDIKTNFPGVPIHNEEVDAFMDDVKDKKFDACMDDVKDDKFEHPKQITVLLTSPPCEPFSNASNGKGGNDDKNRDQLQTTTRALEIFRPAYLFFENVPTLAADKHMEHYRPLLLQILRLGYSLKYTTLNAAEYGVASQRKRLSLVAAAPGFILPSWPEPTHRDPNWEYSEDFTPPAQVFVTVRDAIQDLEWRNPRVHHCSADKHSVYCNIPKDGNHPQPSEYALSLGRQNRGLITHHITGRPAKEEWKEERTLADAGNAVILDHHRFVGPLSRQYKQIGNAVRPLLAKAVAMEIRRVLEDQFLHLLFEELASMSREQSVTTASTVASENSDIRTKSGAVRRTANEVDGLDDDERDPKRFRADVGTGVSSAAGPECTHQ